MKKLLSILLKILLGILGAVLLAALALGGVWLARREDPAAFVPDRYLAYLQVPSIRGIYDRWLNLEAADVVLSRPELRSLRGVLGEARGLALTGSPLLGVLLEVPADVLWLRDSKLLAVVDLGWRGIPTPLARLVGPLLRVPGLSFVNDAGVPMFLYTTGQTTIYVAFRGNVAVVSLEAEVVKQALQRQATGTGLEATASRELLQRIRRRSPEAVRILVDTGSLLAAPASGSPLADRLLSAVELPGQSMLDLELSNDRLRIDAGSPLSVNMPELEKTLDRAPATLGVLRYVPASAYMLTVSNLAPLGELYRLAALLQGQDVQGIYDRADSGSRTVTGLGIEELLFSWVGAEVGAFLLPASAAPVFFARISDQRAFRRAMEAITASGLVNRDSSLVLDEVRVERLSIPWFVGLILDLLRVQVPEPYFLARGDYFFLSLEAANLAAVGRAADTGSNLAQGSLYADLARGIPADPTLLAWYDLGRAEPFFLRGGGLLADVLHLYSRGLAIVRASPDQIQVSLAGARVAGAGAQLLPGFPLQPDGQIAGDVLAFRFAGAGAPVLAWIQDRSRLVLADAGGKHLAEARLEPETALVPQAGPAGGLAALWAASPGGTVWRFGPGLQSLAPFPIATGITGGGMPPAMIDGSLALFSKADATLVLIDPDGGRRALGQRLEAPLFLPPDVLDGHLAFYPKSFEARVHLTDLQGTEAPGWPAQASGISLCAPRFLQDGPTTLVTFLTQAGFLHAWDLSGAQVQWFPVSLPGVFYATPEPIVVNGRTCLVALAQDGGLSLVSMDGKVLRQARVPDLDGKLARIFLGDLDRDGVKEILLYGSGAFIAGYDEWFRPLPGFPVKGVTRPQLLDLDRDGRTDLLTAGLDGKIYAYTMGRGRP
jgi:hypothetical protein